MASRPNLICATVVSCPATSMPAAGPIASSSVALPSRTAALRKFQKRVRTRSGTLGSVDSWDSQG